MTTARPQRVTRGHSANVTVLAGALTAIVVWLIEQTGLHVPPDIAVAIATVLRCAAHPFE